MDKSPRHHGEIYVYPVKGDESVTCFANDGLTLVQYIGLQILEKLITTRWKTLPDGQRQGTPPSHSWFS